MPEKPPVFTVTDRRKFTLEGDLRDEAADASSSTEEAPPASSAAPAPGPRLVTNAPPPKGPEAASTAEQKSPEPVEKDLETPPEVSAQDEAAARHAYRQSSDHIDTMLRAANPAAGATPAVTIEHVIQSIYLSAVVALGAAAEPGQKPHIDILGARQSIDMLGALQEKTKGNLSEKEQRLLQNALFEVRMMFLEVTNAIAQQAQRPPQGKK
ncbi:MAG TPA: DUF1844 domain-containing protein [Silvibacterium sp.]|nr:DUF1844 domain-containing protein [Silvibacterium sp.]